MCNGAPAGPFLEQSFPDFHPLHWQESGSEVKKPWAYMDAVHQEDRHVCRWLLLYLDKRGVYKLGDLCHIYPFQDMKAWLALMVFR